MSSITFNSSVSLIISDVDETIAPLYKPTRPELIKVLEELLQENKHLLLITGQAIDGIRERIVDFINPSLCSKILMGHCSGAEVWGFGTDGELLNEPYYSYYDQMLTLNQKDEWRKIVDDMILEFQLEVYPTQPPDKFKIESRNKPYAVMFDDRGPQITLEFVNGSNLTPKQLKELGIDIPLRNGRYDLRTPFFEKIEKTLEDANIPVTPRMAGDFSIDLALKGVSKATAVTYVLENTEKCGLPKNLRPQDMEIWGDKFSTINGGTDTHMCEGAGPEVRAIDFRQEPKEELPTQYNIVIWDGEKHLQDGLLEYLQSR